jgi:hypothetical protein
MARERNGEPGSNTAALRNLLQREDLTMKMVRRRTNFVLVAAIVRLRWGMAARLFRLKYHAGD